MTIYNTIYYTYMICYDIIIMVCACVHNIWAGWR